MLTPTANQIRQWSKVEWDSIGYEDTADVDEVPDPLDFLIARAVGFLVNIGGIKFAVITDSPTDPQLNPLLYLGQQVVQMMVELYAFQSADGNTAENASDFDQIQSFSMTGYSETRRASAIPRSLTPWPALNLLIGKLAEATGGFGGMDNTPSVGVREPNLQPVRDSWDVARYIIDARRNQGTVFGPYSPAWDGWFW